MGMLAVGGRRLGDADHGRGRIGDAAVALESVLPHAAAQAALPMRSAIWMREPASRSSGVRMVRLLLLHVDLDGRLVPSESLAGDLVGAVACPSGGVDTHFCVDGGPEPGLVFQVVRRALAALRDEGLGCPKMGRVGPAGEMVMAGPTAIWTATQPGAVFTCTMSATLPVELAV